MKIIVAQFGVRMHYAVPRMFYEDGMFELLYTDIYIGNKPWLKSCLASFANLTRLFKNSQVGTRLLFHLRRLSPLTGWDSGTGGDKGKL